MKADCWFAVETLPRSEVQSRANLERQHFPCFLPRFKKTRRHARRTDQILAPIFPGYLFVRFDPDRDPWRSINGTVGVKRLVSFDGRPRPMPDGAMEVLFARCDDQIVLKQITSLVPGQQVRFTSGPLADRLATIDELDDKGRVNVLLEILGHSSSVRVSASWLGPV